MYTPGMLTDVVREVKEAARVREDALLSRVRAIVDERSWSTDVNVKLCRDLEEMKVIFDENCWCKIAKKSSSPNFQLQLNVMRTERSETNARMLKMEDEIKELRSLVFHVLNNGSNRQNVGYPINSSFNERDFSHSSTHSCERHSRRFLNIENPVSPNENEILLPMTHLPHSNRSSDKMQFVPGYLENSPLHGHMNGVYATPNDVNDSDMQKEKETLKLRKEIQDLRDSKQKADSKIHEYVQSTGAEPIFLHEATNNKKIFFLSFVQSRTHC